MDLLHNLPKDILVSLLKKTYDFKSLPFNDVLAIKKEIDDSLRHRIVEKTSKAYEILAEIYSIEDFTISVIFEGIVIDKGEENLFKIFLHGHNYTIATPTKRSSLLSYDKLLTKIKKNFELPDRVFAILKNIFNAFSTINTMNIIRAKWKL